VRVLKSWKVSSDAFFNKGRDETIFKKITLITHNDIMNNVAIAGRQ